MKKILLLLSLIAVFMFVKPSFAQVGMMGGNTSSGSSEQTQLQQNLNQVFQEILKPQGATSTANIDCSKITDDQFEKLGDAWMGVHAGSEAVHQRMEQMMGGEGSQNLKQAHINMGKSYLGCSQNGKGISMMSGVQGPMRGGANSMMGFGYGMMNGYYGFGGNLLSLAVWTFVLIDLILLGVFLWKKIRK